MYLYESNSMLFEISLNLIKNKKNKENKNNRDVNQNKEPKKIEKMVFEILKTNNEKIKILKIMMIKNINI